MDANERDPILAVLEAAGREGWYADRWHGRSGIVQAVAENRPPAYRAEAPEQFAPAIVRAVNSFAGAREALRAVAHPWPGAGFHCHECKGREDIHERRCWTGKVRDLARAALAAMEGKP